MHSKFGKPRGLAVFTYSGAPELASKSREKRRLCRKLLSARSCQASSYSLLLIMPPSLTTALYSGQGSQSVKQQQPLSRNGRIDGQ